MSNIAKDSAEIVAVTSAAPISPVSTVDVQWYEEVEEADDKERQAKRKVFFKEWAATKRGGKPSEDSKVFEKAWLKASSDVSLTDGAWLKERHQITEYPSWKPKDKKKLPETLPFDSDRFKVAALNCGYGICGKELDGKGHEKTGAWIDPAFAQCIQLRTEYLLSTIDFANVQLQSFMSMLETSDRADVSFLIGSATAYIVADAWLACGNRKLIAFWHVSLYCAALVEGARGTAFKNTDIGAKEKAPDFLAVDDQGEVHLFESKGGKAAKNNEVLRKALNQLSTIKRVSLYKSTGPSKKTRVATRMAVRTVVDLDQKIKVLAFDPPANAEGTHLQIDMDVARGLQALESEQLFVNHPSPVWQLDSGLLVRKIEDTHVVICTSAPYRDLRRKLSAYLAVRNALPNGPIARVINDEADAGKQKWKQLAEERAKQALVDQDDEVKEQFAQAIAIAKAPGNLLPTLSRSLRIPELMSAFDRAIEVAQLQLEMWGDRPFNVRILPCSLIQLIGWDGNMQRRSYAAGVKRKI